MESASDVPRIILNDDGSNFLYSWDDLGAEDLRRYLERLADTQVDMVSYCVAFGGYVCYYESEVAEPVGSGFGFSDRVKQRRWARNRERLRREAGDYIGHVFRVLREMAIPALASFRMNDAHMSSDPHGPVAGRFWMDHPQWRLGSRWGYYGSCMDYSVPAVRAYLRRLVQEVIAKFPDIAGVELDGLRSPFFFNTDDATPRAPLMTQLVRQVRQDLAAAAARVGREPYLLRINVPRSPDLALASGMDVAAWDAEHLIDGISPGCYNTDFQPAVEAWRELLSEEVLVHPYLNCSAATANYLSLEQYRAATANAYGAGADGVYLFNFPCLDELAKLVPRPVTAQAMPPPDLPVGCGHAPVSETRRALCELGDPKAVAQEDKHYLFYVGGSPYRHYTQERATIDRLQPGPVDLGFRCYHGAGAREALLRVKTIAVTVHDEFGFSLNGKPLDEGKIRRLHAPGGRDARVCGVPLEPYSLFEIPLDPAELQTGANCLTVALEHGEDDLFSPIPVAELELLLRH